MSGHLGLKLDFDVGGLDELGYGGFHVGWLDAKDEVTGHRYALTAGAGVGGTHIEASVETEDGRTLYARADVRPLARRLFGELAARMANPDDGLAGQLSGYRPYHHPDCPARDIKAPADPCHCGGLTEPAWAPGDEPGART